MSAPPRATGRRGRPYRKLPRRCSQHPYYGDDSDCYGGPVEEYEIVAIAGDAAGRSSTFGQYCHGWEQAIVDLGSVIYTLVDDYCGEDR